MDTNPRPLKEKLAASSVFGLIPPTDIAAVVAFVVLADVLLLGTGTDAAPIRALFGFPLLLFVPGYVLLAAFFPRRDPRDERSDGMTSPGSSTGSRGTRTVFEGHSITWKERVALSFGSSVALLPVFGLVVAAVVGSLSFGPVLLSVNVFVLAGAAVGIVRRNNLPTDQRFDVPYRRWIGGLRSAVSGRHSRIDSALVVVLVISVLAAASTMGFVLLAPQDGEAYTSATLLTENADGDVVASGYPSEFVQGDGEELVLRVENDEGVETTYTFFVELQRVETSGESVRVTAEDVIVRERNTVEAGDTWLATHTVTPTMTGEDLRLSYTIYRGDPPANPSEESAYRTLYLWIDVSDSTTNE